MTPPPSLELVRQFLQDFKRAATEGKNRTEVWSREKNVNALIELGLSERKRDDIILALKPEDYCEGPMPDENAERGGEVWVFGTEVRGEQVYIKLKVTGTDPLRHAICISFHKAQHPMRYPFRD